MTNSRVLHFSLGPVQSFVGAARRTRDFWAGSYLLSYLVGHAMYEIVKADGEITFPIVKNDPLFQAIDSKQQNQYPKKTPFIGSLPNRFEASIPDGFDPKKCREAVLHAWNQIARAVWNRYVEPVHSLGKNTKEIWDRQVRSFWDIVWVIGEESDLLDRRKNWRSYVPPVESGDKCTLMSGFQELSGFIRTHEKHKQEKFWQELRHIAYDLDLQEGERLCAISLIKRLFPHVAKEAIGWRVDTSYPSTVNMASVHWQEKMIIESPAAVEEFVDLSAKLADTLPEQSSSIACLKAAARTTKQRKFIALDGNLFYVASLQNENLWEEHTKPIREKLVSALAKFPEQPSAFYALLLMDGDSMGALLQDYPKYRKEISAAIGEFSQRVEGIVRKHNGVPVYAGGDDVLAFLPLEDALAAARALRSEYLSSFARNAQEVDKRRTTISAAIVYAHYNAPLKLVLARAHRELDEIAKEATGRDSLAVAVWKTGGVVLTWSQPWDVLVDGDSTLLGKLVAGFRGESGNGRQYASGFFYRIGQLLEIVSDSSGSKVLSDSDVKKLLIAQFLKSREIDVSVAEAEARIEPLIKVCTQHRRDLQGAIHTYHDISNKGALLVRFLAANWKEAHK